MRVLVVEDDAIVGEVLRDLCIELGHEAETAGSAEDALVRVQGNRPDLILLDFRLPGMSGLDFLRLPLVRNAGIPIIVVSGIASDREADECLALGAARFLAKPVPLEQLQRLLRIFDRPAGPSGPAVRPVERRRETRARVALPVRIHEEGGAEWETTSVDLTTQAMKVRAAGSHRPTTTVELEFDPPGEDRRVRVLSLLIRVDLDGYVFYFLNLSEEHFEQLSQLVRRLTVYPPPT